MMLLGDVEKLLRQALQIDEQKNAAFKSRIQHLQRMQFPPGTNTGKGKKFDYGWSQIIQYSVVFDLLDQGMTPEIAVKLVVQHTSAIEGGAARFFRGLATLDECHLMVRDKRVKEGDGLFLHCVVDGLGSLKSESADVHQYIQVLKEDVLLKSEFVAQILSRRNATFVNLSNRLIQALHFVATTSEKGVEDTVQWVKEWADSLDQPSVAMV